MSSRDMTQWETSICETVSTEKTEEVIIRGEPLSELIGEVSFAEMMFLLVQGQRPSEAQTRVLDALLVASMEHGIAPPSMISRCMASYGSPLQAAVAGGVMAFGDTMGGAGEQFAKLLVDHLRDHTTRGTSISDAMLDDIARTIITAARQLNQRIPGFGIPLHGADPRSPKLLDIARAQGVYGPYCRLAIALEAEIEQQTQRRIPLNLDGVGAALILDLGFDWRLSRLFIMTPRTVSMGVHYLEELQQDTQWRHIPAHQIDYRP